jgi:hypothetical protein
MRGGQRTPRVYPERSSQVISPTTSALARSTKRRDPSAAALIERPAGATRKAAPEARRPFMSYGIPQMSASALGLNAEHRRLLKAAGATDLRSIARALQCAGKVETYNTAFARRQKAARKRKTSAEPIRFPLSAAAAAEMRGLVGELVAKSLDANRRE